MKKIIFVFIAFFLFIPFVYAEPGPLIGDKVSPVTSPGFARFYDIGLDGNSVTPVATRGTGYYFNNPDPFTLNNTNSNGGLVCWSGDIVYQEGVLYSVTAYIGVLNSDYVFQNVTVVPGPLNRGVSTGSYLVNAANYYANKDTAKYYFNGSDTSSTISFNNTTITSTLYTGYRFLVFEPKHSGNSICIDFTSVGTYSYFAFFGYHTEPLGVVDGLSSQDIQSAINSSGLATASSVNQVQTSVNALKTEVQSMSEEQKQTNEKLDDLNDTLNNSDVSDAQGSANDFFDNFDTNDYGLSDIISMPLQFINKISSAKCSPIVVPLPFVDTNLTLPCMYDIYQKYFGSILSIYQTVTFGMIAYFICCDIFRMVKNFKDPDKDNVEVMDL